jgi:H+/Cl- antiporter ClcA
MTDPPQPPAPGGELTSDQADALIASRGYVALLLIVAVVGIVVSVAAWCFLELVYQLQQEFYVHLPHAVGYEHSTPQWWPLPILVIGAVLVALAIRLLPGDGGHIPADGLATQGNPDPRFLPGVIAAGLGAIGFGLVLGPEAPLLALGAGIGALSMGVLRHQQPGPVQIVAAAGSFAAVSFIFSSPLIAAVLLIEAAGLGGAKMRVILVPGLLAAGIGSLVSLGIGHFTGLSSSSYALGVLPLPSFARLTIGQFGWSIALGAAVAIVMGCARHGGLLTKRFVRARNQLVLLPLFALVIGGLAIAFSQITGKSSHEVLFSGQSAMPGLVAHAPAWSIAALVWLIAFKGIAYAISLGSYRGGPTFPAVFLGAAAGVIASHLPGFPIGASVAVGIGAATVAILRLPLSSVVLAALLANKAGPIEPLVIVGVVVAYVVTLALRYWIAPESESPGHAGEPEPPASAEPVAST